MYFQYTAILQQNPFEFIRKLLSLSYAIQTGGYK